jgi:spore coat protein A, manganese oxidase
MRPDRWREPEDKGSPLVRSRRGMGSTNRRDFLRLAFGSVSAVALAGAGGAGAEPVYRTLDAIERYIDPLPIPEKLKPYKRRKDADRYRVRMVEFRKQLHSQLPPTKVWGYEGQYPGPTFEAVSGRRVEVRWENQLPLEHLFPVDTRIHGAMPPAPAVRVVPHLHGSRTSSISDGLPEGWFVPGAAALYEYPNEQRAATLWYHDHAMGITRLNVYAGLSGFYLLRDQQELSMDLPSGEYEIPLSLQDRMLSDEGQLVYTPTRDDGVPVPRGTWGPQFFGNVPVVNGAVYPFLNVEPRAYRLRILNACNGRFFNLYLNLAKNPADIPALVQFYQIGSDGGLLQKPAPVEKILLAPAERADLIVDFSGLEGKTVTLSNNATSPFPGWMLLRALYPPLLELMQFRVTLPKSSTGKAFSLPAEIELKRMIAGDAQVTRDFVLTENMDDKGNSLGMQINGKGYADATTEFPKLGSTEMWRFINTTDDTHPMHLHLVQFQILERRGFDFATFVRQEGKVQFVGPPRPPAPNEAGWKDTAIVNPHEVLTILVRFEGYTGRYVFHCHMAEHEDNDMMRPFEVVA